MIQIVTDSGCDIREIESQENKFAYSQVPLTISIGENDYVDNTSLDINKMVEHMVDYKGKSQTACPSPQAWLDEFSKSDEVIAITITSGLSGSYNSAEVARKMALEENPDKKIFILDSLSASGEISLAVYKICELAKKEYDFEKICDELKSYHRKTKLVFSLGSIDNLIKNGRVSKAIGLATNLLGITLIGRASDQGTLEPTNKCRGSAKRIKILIDEMQKMGYAGGKATIAHCYNEQLAQSVKEKLLSEFSDAKVKIMPTSGLCSFYAEVKGLLIGYETEQ